MLKTTQYLIWLAAVLFTTASYASYTPATVLNYQISTFKGFNPSVSKLNIYRAHDAVLYEYVDKKVAVLWSLDADNKLQKSVYADQIKFGIDYLAQDLRASGKQYQLAAQMLRFDVGNSDLSQVASVDSSVAKKLQLAAIEHYAQERGNVRTDLYWQPQLQAVVQFKTNNIQQAQRWELLNFSSDPQLAAAAIAKRRNYESIDFADSGDNENLPQLKVMHRLGVINHASGFYSADGKSIMRPHRH